MKIDVHAHLFSPAYIQGLQRIFENDSTPVGQDAQRLIRWMSSDPRMIDVEGRLEKAYLRGQLGTSLGSRFRADRMSDFRFPRGVGSHKRGGSGDDCTHRAR